MTIDYFNEIALKCQEPSPCGTHANKHVHIKLH